LILLEYNALCIIKFTQHQTRERDDHLGLVIPKRDDKELCLGPLQGIRTELS